MKIIIYIITSSLLCLTLHCQTLATHGELQVIRQSRFEPYLLAFRRLGSKTTNDISLDKKIRLILYIVAVIEENRLNTLDAGVLNEINAEFGSLEVPLGVGFHEEGIYDKIIMNEGAGASRLQSIIFEAQRRIEAKGFQGWPKYLGPIISDN
jgi:hypothetical protein